VTLIFKALGVIPVEAFERDALGGVLPQSPLIAVEAVIERRRVADVKTVVGDVIPWDEDRLERAPALDGTQPLRVEIVADSVGRALDDNQCVGPQRDARTHCPDIVERRMAVRRLPEGHLAQMDHRVVVATSRVLVFARSQRHLAAARGYVAGVDRPLEAAERGLDAVGPVALGVIVEHRGIHAADVRRRVLDVGADERVPVVVVHHLYPRHVHLYQRRPAPLPGLEQYQADGAPGTALTFKPPEHHALGTVENERHHLARQFVTDGDTARRPQLKVVPETRHLIGDTSLGRK